ncbi:MAG: MFS transporter [Candidatus Eisenbacteria bacterium]|nr:MFS transporter [Candidatus Eisenbacteria bacterium]
MYDWANSAFITTVTAALYPPFFRSLATSAGLSKSEATAYWGYVSSAALLTVAVLAPLLGATADHTGGRKKYMAAFAGLGICVTASFMFIGGDAWRVAAALFVLATIGFAGANVFYDSFLPRVSARGHLDRVSSRGFALGYLGGGVLLVLNLLWVTYPGFFGLPNRDLAVRFSFLSVAVWWALFSIPFFRNVPEPGVFGRPAHPRAAVIEGFGRLVRTFREVRRYRQLFLFLVAFWIYTDGVGTIVRMATAYGDDVGIGIDDMVAALVITQFVGIPFTMLFAKLAERIGPKPSILITLGVYAGIAGSAYFMSTAAHFYALAIAVATVQGGCQALSRSLFSRMVPDEMGSEFFGFYSASSKFAGVFGPLVFGAIAHATGESRLGILSVVLFFVVGGVLLGRVDVERGEALASSDNRV